MVNASPGRFPDPTDKSKMRWWDGKAWSPHVSRDGTVWAEPLPDRPRGARLWRMPTWAWIVVGVILLIPVLLLAPIVAPIALVILITALVAIITRRRTWLRLGSRKSAIAVTSVAAVVLLATGGISAGALSSAGSRTQSEAVKFADTGSGGTDDAVVAEATPTSTPTPTRTPKPTPTPVVKNEVVTEVIAFERTTIEDPALPQGQTQVVTGGQNGTRTLTYAVTTLNGVETARELVSDEVTVAPVAEVTSVGTYDAPPPPEPVPLAPAGSGCDPNYAEACVPIDSDVDCAGGSGNGPSYFGEVARVVGSDIYELDRDGDGYACEPW